MQLRRVGRFGILLLLRGEVTRELLVMVAADPGNLFRRTRERARRTFWTPPGVITSPELDPN